MVSKEQKDRFKRQAEAIAKRLNTNLRYDETALPPPHIVEFTGSPSSGKTTTIKQVYTFLRRHGFEVLMPQEGAEVIPARLRKSPEYNMQTGLYALRILLSETANHAYDFILFDRCIFDAYHWLLYWNEKEKLSTKEMEQFQSFFLSPKFTDKIGLAFVMVCEPEVAIQRETEIALSDKLGETTNPESIKKMVRHFTEMYRSLEEEYPQLQLIETTNLSRKEMILQVGSEILRVFERNEH